MPARLNVATLIALLLPPLLWASNSILARMVLAGESPLISPVLLNATRWLVALILLVLLTGVMRWRMSARAVAAAPLGAEPIAIPELPTASGAWSKSWRVYAVLGLLSVASYNALQYYALKQTTAINATLIASSGPLWGLLLGWAFFGAPGSRSAWLGGALSLLGVLCVLAGGELERLLMLRLAWGDLLMLLAIMVWGLYSWVLRRHRPAASSVSFLLAQTIWGLVLMQPLVAVEWLGGGLVLTPVWQTAAVIFWVGLGPSLLAYWCWDQGVAHAGPLLPMFFSNLTPLFTALMSAWLLGEMPRPYHAVAFVCIVGGIFLSNRRA